jgi:hypothetical protein
VDDVTYKDYTIEVISLRIPGPIFRPRAVLYTERSGGIATPPVLEAPNGETFPTVEEANAFAVEMAKRWIDANGESL